MTKFANFYSFITERVYKITNSEEKDIDKLVKKYKDIFFKDIKTKVKILQKTPKEYFSGDLDENDRLLLGNIKIKDLENDKSKKVNILVDFTKGDTNRGEFIDSSNEVILYYYALGFNEDTIRDTLTHELLHGKQQYKKMGKKYRKAIKKRRLPSGEAAFRSNRDYFLDPLEYPIYTTLIIKEFAREYESLDKFGKSKFRNFLLNFIKTGAKPVLTDNTPDFLIEKMHFLRILFRNRKQSSYRGIYKNFIKKLAWLYNKLT